MLFTQFIDDVDQIPAESFELCPAIYQEYIPGTRHIRVNVFGRDAIAALIESSDLDWRPNLNVPITRWQLGLELSDKIQRAMTMFGLRMGIIDMKITESGEIVWLEINPQGQFLFLEGLAGLPLTNAFVEFLTNEWQVALDSTSADFG